MFKFQELLEEITKEQDTNLESLARVAHEVWMDWAKNIIETEDISPERVKRWEEECFMPYDELSEEMKELDREQAQKYLDALAHPVEKDVDV